MNASAQIIREAERIEREAWADLMSAPDDALKSAQGLRCERLGDGLMIAVPGLPAVLFNRAFALGLDGPPDVAQIDRIRAFFSGHRVGTWAAQPSLGPHGEAWAEALQQAGLKPMPMRWAKTAREPRPVSAAEAPTAGYTIREVGAGQAQHYAGPIVRGMGLPPWFASFSGALPGRPRWRTYAAFDEEGKPFAAAALFIDGPTAWLGTATTEAAGRGRGAQRALMARRINDAIDAGATLICTETGEPQPGQPSPSFHNMMGIGFEVVGYRVQYGV